MSCQNGVAFCLPEERKLSVLTCAGSLIIRLGSGGKSKNTAGQKCRLHSVCRSDRVGQGKGCTSFVARVLLSMPSLEELSRSFFELSLRVAPDLGRQVSFATIVAERCRTPKPGFPASADTTCLTRKQRAQKLYGTTTAWTTPRCAYTRLEMRELLYWKGEGM